MNTGVRSLKPFSYPIMTNFGLEKDTFKEIRISDLVLITSSLKNIVAPLFGPVCKQTLLKTNTGQVVFTKDAYSILSALSLPHPVAGYIISSLNAHRNTHGDGCKTLVLYLNELILSIQSNFTNLTCANESKTCKSWISLSLTKFIKEDFTTVCNDVHKIHQEMYSQFTLGSALECVIKTTLSGTLPKETHDHILNLITLFFTDTSNGTVSSLHEILNLIFQSCVYITPNKSYLNSHIETGLFFHGSFSQHQSELFLKNVKFVMTLCPIDKHIDGADNDNCCIDFQSALSSESIMLQRTAVVKDFLSCLLKSCASLVLTTQKVPDFAIQLFKINGVALVSCVDKDDIDFLSMYTGKVPIVSVYDDITETNICETELCEKLLHSGKPILRIICQSTFPWWVGKSLFLYAPSDGLCQQLRCIIKKCFKVVSVFLREHNHGLSFRMEENASQSLNIIPGGGYFEYLLAFHMEKYSQQQVLSPNVKMWTKIVTKMLYAVPHQLYQNLNPSKSDKVSGFLLSSHQANDTIKSGATMGFCKKGCICDVSSDGVMDVFSSKLASCFTALDIATCLLRIDSIINVKRISP